MSAPPTDVLAQEHERLRADAKRARAEFARSPQGKWAAFMWGAVESYLRMRADGVPREDALKGLELVVREHWPRGREREWKYLCETCRDTGWRYDECRRFHRCKPEHDDLHEERSHVYVTPCSCSKGDRFRRQAETLDSEAELAQVGRRKKKPTGFTRIGR